MLHSLQLRIAAFLFPAVRKELQWGLDNSRDLYRVGVKDITPDEGLVRYTERTY